MQAAEPRNLTQPGSPPIGAISSGQSVTRYLGLAVVFALATAALAIIDRQPDVRDARWPSAESGIFAIDGWSVSQPTVEAQNGNHYITYNYARPGARVSASITTSTEAKRVYRAGAAIPFLGNGYTVDQVPPSMLAHKADRSALLVRREDEVGLLIFAYGERRGAIGNGAAGWAVVALDALLDRPNDYYLLRVYAPLASSDQASIGAIAALADELFGRVAAWYAA